MIPSTRLLFLLLLSLSPALAESVPSVLPNGDFEQADPANPQKAAHWDLTDGLGVQWTDAPPIPGTPSHGKAIRMDTAVPETTLVESYTRAGLTQWVFPHPQGNAIAETYGLSLYSEAVPLEPGKAYRVTFDYFSEKGTAGKVWFRCYGDLNGTGVTKRLYEGVVDCASKGTWQTFSGLFHPFKHRPNVTQFKVMLFSYYPAGVCWYDNVRVEAVDEVPAAPAQP